MTLTTMRMSTTDASGGLETIGIPVQTKSLDEIEIRGLTEARALIVQIEILEIRVTHEVPRPIANHPAGRTHEPLEISVQKVLGLLLLLLPPVLLQETTHV